MIFNSIHFLEFILIFIPLYYFFKGKLRLWFTLAASYFFYGYWDYSFLALVLASTVFEYNLALYLEKTEDEKKRKRLLITSIVFNLVILGFFKYFNFFIDSTNSVLGLFGTGTIHNTLHIILPIGISFYTFQAISYTTDVYKRKIKAETDFAAFSVYSIFFAKLTAGPILRAHDFLPQLKTDQKFTWDNFETGLARVLLGFAKKIIIADSLGSFVGTAFAFPDKYSSLYLIIGIIFYSFQIYCDFSGYSDIAIGIARILGYRFPENFNFPYLAKNFSEFWSRWHMSLSSWLREYLYIPLGGNRNGKFNAYRNLMITMLLGGLWHGANWTFVVWGGLNGVYLVVQRLILPYTERMGKIVPRQLFIPSAMIIVFLLTCFSRIFFRSNDFDSAFEMIKGVFAFNDMSFGHLPNKFVIIKNLGLVSILMILEYVHQSNDFEALVLKSPAFKIITFSAILWMIALFGTFSDSQFIYIQF